MNKIFLGLLLSFNTLMALEFHSYKEALVLQQKTGKPIMLDIMRTNCHYCQNMQKKVFDNKEMSKWLEKRFIAVEINLDFDEIPIDVKVYFTPTFYFLDKKQNIIKKIPGSWNIQDFKDLTKGIR